MKILLSPRTWLLVGALLAHAEREPDTISVRTLHREDEAMVTSTGVPKKE